MDDTPTSAKSFRKALMDGIDQDDGINDDTVSVLVRRP